MLAVVMLCTIISLLCLSLRQTERRAVFWLAMFVISGLVTAIPVAIGFAGAFDVWPGLTFLPTQMTLLYGPLIYLHARSLMIEGSVQRWLWWLIPGGVYWLYQVWAFLFLGGYEAKWAFNKAVHYPFVLPVVFYLGVCFTVGGIFAIWSMHRRYLCWLEQNRSDNEEFAPIWLTHLIAIGVPLISIWVIENIVGRYFDFDYFERFWADFSAVFLLFFISVEALARIHQPFPKMPNNAGIAAPSPSANQAEYRDWNEEAKKLKREVIENQWHLEAGLALSDLARRMATNHAYLSKTLNQGMGQTFSHFVNSLRVEDAKALIEAGERSMIEIALDVGFGSKSSFNRAFKQHTKLTPTEFAARTSKKTQSTL